jgi:hypothetical protein
MKSKFMKDLGHAVIDQTDANNIINAAATQGIYDLTLGFSDKEKRAMVTGKAHDASAITFGKAKEGSMEAYNFSLVQSVTSTHLVTRSKKAAKTDALVKSLAKSVFSINTGTSKVTKDNDTADSEKESSSDSKEDGSQPGKKAVAIKGMGILIGQDDEHKATKTGKEKDKVMKGAGSKDSKAEDNEEEFQDNKEMVKAGADLTKRMEAASEELTNTSEDEGTHNIPIDLLSSNNNGKTYKENDSTANPGDDELSMLGYVSDVVKVDSGKFEAAHAQKYTAPDNFCQALWNEVGPSVRSMKILLGMLRTEFEGELVGVPADLTTYSQVLTNFLIEEAGKDPRDAIAFLEMTLAQISQYKVENPKETDAYEAPNKDPNALPPDKEDKQIVASKTQGMLPRAPEVSPAEGVATTINMTDRDEEGPQSVSMASGG